MKHLLIALFLSLASCASSPIVASAVFEGEGVAKTDSNALVAVGTFDGDFEVYAKEGGFPVVFPVLVSEGEVFLFNKELGVSGTQSVTEPLPEWARELFRPGEIAAINARFGYGLREFDPGD